jgi:hypothetical protein
LIAIHIHLSVDLHNARTRPVSEDHATTRYSAQINPWVQDDVPQRIDASLFTPTSTLSSPI